MKWFRHDSAANRDAKLQKIRMKYGLEGYGLYWYCVELIAEGVEDSCLTFELEHDAEIISFNTGVHAERVEEMMAYMVKLGLFENHDGTITCYKLARRLDQSSTSNAHMRKIISEIKSNPDYIMTLSERNHDGVMTKSDQSRVDKSREDKKSNSAPKPKKHPFPSDFEITQAMRDWFSKQSFAIAIETATDDWQDNMLKNTSKYQYTDWTAAWRSAMKKAEQWHQERQPKATQPKRRNPLPNPRGET